MHVTNPVTNKHLSLDELKAELALATLAGFETTSNGITWIMAMLLTHPDALNKLEQVNKIIVSIVAQVLPEQIDTFSAVNWFVQCTCGVYGNMPCISYWSQYHFSIACCQELDQAGLLVTSDRPQPRLFDWSDLGRLPYLNAVIKEGLRLFSPAATGSWRLTDKHLDINGLKLPKVIGAALLSP